MTPFRFILLLAIILSTVVGGCKEKNTPFTTDADEIKLLISKSEEGRDLFRVDSLIIPTNYTVPYDSDGVYRDSVIHVARSIDVTISPFRVPYWSPRGLQTEAVARITDEFTVRTTQTYADTVIVDTTLRDITRFAFLLHLGAETDAYKGWYLWGFNGGGSNSIDVNVVPSSGTSFPGDADLYQQVHAANFDFSADSGYTFGGLTYVRLADIRQLPDGGELAIATHAINSGSSTKRPMVRLNAAGSNGFFSRTMIQIDRNNYVDTIQTPTNNPRIWNIVYLETFHDTEFFFTGAHVFAYRVPAL